MQNIRRLKAFIDNGTYSENFEMQNGIINVKQGSRTDNLTSYPLYKEAKIYGCKTDWEIWQWLKKNKWDFNSRFRKTFGITLDEYAKQH